MSNYIAAGITDEDLIYKAPGAETEPGFNPFFALFDFIDKTKLDIELAITDPKVQAFMREAGMNAEKAKIALLNEQRRREEKSSMLKWGAAAAVVGFLLLRKKR